LECRWEIFPCYSQLWELHEEISLDIHNFGIQMRSIPMLFTTLENIPMIFTTLGITWEQDTDGKYSHEIHNFGNYMKKCSHDIHNFGIRMGNIHIVFTTLGMT